MLFPINSSRVSSPGSGSIACGLVSTAGFIQSLGDGSFASGRSSDLSQLISSGLGSHAFGYVNHSGSILLASGNGSFVSGANDSNLAGEARGIGSVVMISLESGGSALATGNGAVIIGLIGAPTLSSGDGAMSFGSGHNVSGAYATAFGLGHIAQSYSCFCLGDFGTAAGNSAAPISTDPAFIIGNGISVGARSNAYQIDKDGKQTTIAAHKDAVRVIVGTDTLSARTDYKAVCNAGAGAFVLNLPVGEAGLNFIISQASTNLGTFTITPNGGNTLDPNVQTVFNSNQSCPVTFIGGIWYQV